MDSRISRWARIVGAGIFAGIAAGGVAGVCARVAMRFIAESIGRMSNFTIPGTSIILFAGIGAGIPIAVSYAVLKRFIPGREILKGLLFSAVLFLPLGPLFFFLEPDLEVSPVLGRILFSIIPFVFGIVLGLAFPIIDRSLPPPTREWKAMTLYGVAAIFGGLALLFIGAVIQSAFGAGA
jgi:hypothetical protein